jgi:hypothetical protein
MLISFHASASSFCVVLAPDQERLLAQNKAFLGSVSTGVTQAWDSSYLQSPPYIKMKI